MLRRLLAFVLVAPLAMLAVYVFLAGFGPASSNPDLSWGEFWRLPWRAATSHSVGPAGNGYGENTHAAGLDYWALDFQVPESDYVMATAEGKVIYSELQDQCGPTLGYGTYLDIQDPAGLVHRYAHLQEAYFWWDDPEIQGDEGHDYVMPGWAIGKSGHTGHSEPCSGAHLHYRVTYQDCPEGRCIPEPLSDQCADWWSYKGYPIWCGFMGEDYAFSHDPSYGGDPWKNNYHLSNNAGVGDYPVVEGQPIAYDAAIQARYLDEGEVYGGEEQWSSRVVGKPVNPHGAGWYVHRWDSYPLFTGVLQDFDRFPEGDDIDSPDPVFGAGAIMHGDNVVHDPVDGRADIPAMWVFGDFWWKYTSYCQGIQYIHYLGYPTTEQYEFDYMGAHFWWQKFQGGNIVKTDGDYVVNAWDLNNQPFAASCDGPDTDWDGVSDGYDNCPYDYNPFQENTDSGPPPSGTAAIGNGVSLNLPTVDDGTVPNGDSLGDACDPDLDNDGTPNGSDGDPGGDITYDDNGDGAACLASVGGSDPADDGPSWDSNCNGKLEGLEATCPLPVNPNGDDDGDGLLNTWEVCKWGTNPAVTDSDGDTTGDCREVADTDGNTILDYGGDGLNSAKVTLLPPGLGPPAQPETFGKDGDFDLNGNGLLVFGEDTLPVIRFALGLEPCQ